ncbi:MAG: hypothetical protein IPG71_04040 [bacterium]|nr:hypothetical protein [bacterium]
MRTRVLCLPLVCVAALLMLSCDDEGGTGNNIEVVPAGYGRITGSVTDQSETAIPSASISYSYELDVAIPFERF